MTEVIVQNLGTILAVTGGGSAFAAAAWKLLQVAGCKQTSPAQEYESNSGAMPDEEEAP